MEYCLAFSVMQNNSPYNTYVQGASSVRAQFFVFKTRTARKSTQTSSMSTDGIDFLKIPMNFVRGSRASKSCCSCDTHLDDEMDWIEVWLYNCFRIFSISIFTTLWVALGALHAQPRGGFGRSGNGSLSRKKQPFFCAELARTTKGGTTPVDSSLSQVVETGNYA